MNDLKDVKLEINRIINSNNIKENEETLVRFIPEIKNMIGFEHKHPHHHLDVWEHTLAVMDNIKEEDLELKMAALLHDIGKPFSYQDGEVRHFHGHPEVSAKMTRNILERLGYDSDFINNVYYLVKTHDTVIECDKLDNRYEMILKRLKLQYADAMAHAPGTVEKRINYLNSIKVQLEKNKEIDYSR